MWLLLRRAEKRTRIGKELSGALVATLAGMALSNLGVLPHDAKECGIVFKFILPLAIPMLLFSADLRCAQMGCAVRSIYCQWPVRLGRACRLRVERPALSTALFWMHGTNKDLGGELPWCSTVFDGRSEGLLACVADGGSWPSVVLIRHKPWIPSLFKPYLIFTVLN